MAPLPGDLLGFSLGEVVVLENLASSIHLIAGVLFAATGCLRLGFTAYTSYQVVMTLVKFAFADWYTASDLDWDLVGDMIELLAGVGAVYSLGVQGRLRGTASRILCNSRLVLAVFVAVATYWTVLIATGWSPPSKP